jgi:hypothetical protein
VHNGYLAFGGDSFNEVSFLEVINTARTLAYID